jgi:acetolactate synthase-1/2/3 large subunit
VVAVTVNLYKVLSDFIDIIQRIGAIGMTGLDFETAVREDIPILSVLLNNYEMAAYDTPFSGDWATVAEGLGGYGERIEDPDAVPDALERGIQKTHEGTPVLLEFITARENDLSLTDRY